MKFSDYDLIVFDVDGTLYFQNKLRITMIKRLMGYYLVHPYKFKDLFVILKFRAIREDAENTDNIYEITSKKCKVSSERVKEVVKKWIYDNPLDAVAKSKDTELLDVIDRLKNEGKEIAIWSDYAADDKLKAMGIVCEHVYTAEDERVGELKPSPKGLNLIISDLNIDKDKVLMVGDRMVKDGEAAKTAGVDYLILSKSSKERHEQIKGLLDEHKSGA